MEKQLTHEAGDFINLQLREAPGGPGGAAVEASLESPRRGTHSHSCHTEWSWSESFERVDAPLDLVPAGIPVPVAGSGATAPAGGPGRRRAPAAC